MAFVAVDAGSFQQVNEGEEIVFAQVAQHLGGELGDDGVHLGEEVEAGIGDEGVDDAAVFFVTSLTDELESFETGEQASDVGVGGDHPVSDGGAGKALGVGAAEDAQHVVLRGGDIPAPGGVLHGALQAVGGADEVEESLFGGAGEGAILRDLRFEAGQNSPRKGGVS